MLSLCISRVIKYGQNRTEPSWYYFAGLVLNYRQSLTCFARGHQVITARAPSSAALSQSDLFKSHTQTLTTVEQAERSYLRAEAIAKLYKMTVEDVALLSPKFWALHRDPILCLDVAATTLLTIHYNVVVGTIATLGRDRQDLRPLIDDLMAYKIFGQYCLTEVGHGLDASSLETTATLQNDGSFELHTVNEQAAKYMPPTVPVLGRPCVAVVFAQLIVNNERRGIRPFIVNINDGRLMCKGISARLLPKRHGSAAVNHSITSFERVHLPSSALLGSLEMPTSVHQNFLRLIGRIGVGTLALSSFNIPLLQIASHIAYYYSLRRKIDGRNGNLVPILSFRTQQLPVFRGVAQCYVLEALSKHAVKHFLDTTLDHRVRHAVATIYKTVACQHARTSHFELSERCGAQGLFDYNQIVSQYSEMRGISIAEGDVLVLSIRLASELCIGRYAIPVASNSESLLAKCEVALVGQCQQITKAHGHRSKEYLAYVLSRSQAIVEAIGHRMAYDAAVEAKVPQPLIDIYLCHVISLNLALYIETGLLTRTELEKMEATAFEAAYPLMKAWVDQMNVAPYVRAPIVTNERWSDFVRQLPCFTDAEKDRQIFN